MRRFDCNCFAGSWPFHRIRYNTPEKVAELHGRAGVHGGLMASLEAIFYQDPWEADSVLAEALRGTQYLHAQTINPRHPGWEGMLSRGVEAGVRAVRIYPGFHGYELDDPALIPFCDALRAYRRPLVLSMRLEDARITHMVHPKPVNINFVAYFLATQKGIPTLIANAETSEIAAVQGLMQARGDVWVDTAGMRGGQYNVQRAAEAGYAERLVFGSAAPLFELMSTVCTVDMDPCEESVKQAVWSGGGFVDALKP